jgi:hypothetical protein
VSRLGGPCVRHACDPVGAKQSDYIAEVFLLYILPWGGGVNVHIELFGHFWMYSHFSDHNRVYTHIKWAPRHPIW